MIPQLIVADNACITNGEDISISVFYHCDEDDDGGGDDDGDDDDDDDDDAGGDDDDDDGDDHDDDDYDDHDDHDDVNSNRILHIYRHIMFYSRFLTIPGWSASLT